MLRPLFSPGTRAALSALCCVTFLLASGCSNDTAPADTTGGTADTGVLDTGEPPDTGDTPDAGGGTDTVAQDTATGECSVDDDCKGKLGDLGVCEAAVCNKGTCEKAAKQVGGDCDDGQKCTSNDKCDAKGECKGTVDCPGDTCNVGICNTQGECDTETVPTAQKKPCDDGNACTEDDLCGFGTCSGTAFDPKVKCDDDNSCTNDGCDSKSGCTHDPEDKDAACTDNDACTAGDKCDDKGTCLSGTKVTCNDNDPCTEDVCDKTKGCEFKPYQNGVTCDDGDKCTEKDECTDGKCKGSLKPEAQSPNPCLTVQCDPPTGKITTQAVADGKGCDDSDGCTTGDICAAGICKGKPLICNDGNPCTADKCDTKTGKCGAEPVKDGTKCDDGNACTTKDACLKGTCGGESYTTSKQCDDDNPCTNDGCSPQSGCFHVPKNGSFCDDGNKCTELDKCISGKCTGGAKNCNDNKPCTNDTCDPKTGSCAHSTFVGPCDDGNQCTKDDVCTAGKCDGTKVDCDDGNTCTQDICDTVTGCKYIPLPGGTQCDDGVGCTQNDQCDLGKCTGTNTCVKCQSDLECAKFDDGNPCNGVARCINSKLGKVCDIDPKSVVKCDAYDDPSCGANICNSKTGKCELVKKQQGVPCVSGNKCLSDTICSAAGKCVGETKTCNDNEVCTDDSCDPQTGCKNVAKKDGTTCNDDNVCTSGETCTKGLCSSPVNNCKCTTNADCAKWDDGDLCNGVFSCTNGLCAINPASVVTCDPSKDSCLENLCGKKTGKCELTPVKDGKVCDDGSKCTIQEVCTKGKCTSAAKLQCDDGNKCTINVCNPPTGCESGNIGDGGPCNDGNACTKNDKCLKGTCAGTKTECNDDNPCTIDLCDSKSGKCTALLDNKLKCDDGEPCTEGDKCVDGVCKSSPINCDDKNPCTVDGCDGKGGCLNKLEVNKDCDDGNACTALDRCDQLGKCAGKAKDCDDGSECTEDSCVNGACVVKAAVGKPCNDGNACTEKDACSNKGTCEASKVECDDGNVCTKVAGPCSPVNGCTVVPDDGKNCNDGDACTYLDKCSKGGCEGTKVNCNDNNLCTVDSCDPKTGCVNKQNTCDDDNECTFDKCDKVKGCVHSALDGKQPCDDGDPCTVQGVCNKAKCESKLKQCDDKNPCTSDTCAQPKGDDKGGCVYLPIENTATVCDDDDPCTDNFCDGKGKCKITPKDCDDDNACTTDACVKGKGCQYTDAQDGAECDDGDVCSAKSACQGGFCIAKDKALCTTCKDNNGCKSQDDNNLCNGKFVCVKKKETDELGYCIEDKTPVVCDTTGDLPCSKNVCVTTTGECKVTQLVNGTKCDDGQPCTAGDVCTNGECKAAGFVDCSNTSDTCNEATCVPDDTAQAGYSCVPLPKPGTIACDADGDPCTTNDTCVDGKCQAGKKVDCEGVGGECEVAACVKAKDGGFTCKISAAKDGTKCDDGQLCTAGDSCKSGKCQPGTDPYDCSGDVNSACATGVCDKTNNGGKGGCTAKAKNEGGECNADDNGCTVGDKCTQGVCVPGIPPNCNGKTAACTVGACKSTGNTGYECVAAPVNESKPCEADKNGCTLDDKCVAGKCIPGKLRDCSALDGSKGCLVGKCESLSSSSSKCVSAPAKSGVPCDADGNGCTQGDTCNGKGACQPGSPVNCLKETSGCGQGTCKSTGATKYACETDPKPKGTKCDADGDGCTVDDACDGAGKCVAGKAPDCSKEDKGNCIVGACKNKGSTSYICEAAPKKNGSACDADKNGCTVNDACELGFCTEGALETCKKLQSACATAACESESSTAWKCKVTPVTSYPPLKEQKICDPTAKAGEKDACATGYKCVKPDKNATVSVCEPVATVTCADGDPCLEESVCVGGECKGQKEKDCNDDDPCTLDACKDGKCSNTKIEGCGACLTMDFEEGAINGGIIQTSSKAVTTSTPQGGSSQGQSALLVTWDGTKDKDAKADIGDESASIHLRRMYLEADAAHTLTFFYKATTVTNETCLEVVANGESKWKQCGVVGGNLQNGYGQANVDLSAFAGMSLDVELRVNVAYNNKAKGEARIDHVQLSGVCGPGCLGTALEVPVFEGKPLAKETAIPQPWLIATKAKNFIRWQVNDKAGRSGTASLRAAWTGGSPDGKAYDTTLTIPEVQVYPDTKLRFAVRATSVGEGGCGGDTLTVKAGGNVVHTECNKITTWKVITVDLKSLAGKTVDIEFIAASGKSKDSAGAFELDDVAVSGQCTYVCYRQQFDGSLGDMKSVGQGTPPVTWAYATDQAVSKPGAAKVDIDSKVASATYGGLGINEASNVQPIRVPVMGMSVSAQVNAFVTPAINSCTLQDGTPDPDTAALNVGVLLVDMEAIPDAPAAAEPKNALSLATPCGSTSGFTKLGGNLPAWTLTKRVSPLVLARRAKKLQTLKAYVDDFKLICK